MKPALVSRYKHVGNNKVQPLTVERIDGDCRVQAVQDLASIQFKCLDPELGQIGAILHDQNLLGLAVVIQ